MGFPVAEKIQISGLVGGIEPVTVMPNSVVLRQSLLIELPPNQRLQFTRFRWKLLTDQDLPSSIHFEMASDPDIGSEAFVGLANEGDSDTFIPPLYNSTANPVNVYVNIYLRSNLNENVNVLPLGSSWWVSISRLIGPPV